MSLEELYAKMLHSYHIRREEWLRDSIEGKNIDLQIRKLEVVVKDGIETYYVDNEVLCSCPSMSKILEDMWKNYAN